MPRNNFDQLPGSAMVRQKQLVDEVVPFSGMTLWRHVKNGKFPQPIRLEGSRMTAWKVEDVRKWQASQGAAA